jgi:hypothetical protein
LCCKIAVELHADAAETGLATGKSVLFNALLIQSEMLPDSFFPSNYKPHEYLYSSLSPLKFCV